jgi:hypothetical protein
MPRKILFKIIWAGLFCLGLGVFISILTASPVSAQCGSNPPPDSSCYSCHVQENPVAGLGDWHGVHARKDCCAKCHGGNCSTMDEDQAHLGVVANPLSDIYTNCHSCHPEDYLAKAEVFAAELDITPGSIATPTPVPVGKVVVAPLVTLPSPIAMNTSNLPPLLVLGGSLVVILFVVGIIILTTHLHT